MQAIGLIGEKHGAFGDLNEKSSSVMEIGVFAPKVFWVALINRLERTRFFTPLMALAFRPIESKLQKTLRESRIEF